MAAFQTFGTTHLIALLIVGLVWILTLVYAGKIASPAQQVILGRMIAVALLAHQVVYNGYHITQGTWSYRETLPLHLCGFSIFLVAYALWTHDRRLFNVIYFWGIPGTLNSLLTPNLVFTFPHFRFIEFFISHGLIILGVLHIIVTTDFRPSFAGLHRVFGLTLIVTVIVGLFNWATGSNYMFLCRPPLGDNIINHYLSPWPWYIPQLALIALLHFYIVYFPVALFNRRATVPMPEVES